MNSLVGFSFTDSPVHYLSHKGFVFTENPSQKEHGYIEFECKLSNYSFIIREILDEELYLLKLKDKRFIPYELLETHKNEAAEYIDFPNSVYAAEAILKDDLDSCELRDYLIIRKKYPIWALHLNCKNFDKFVEIAKPEKIISYKNKKAALIHLGESCFDLVITEK